MTGSSPHSSYTDAVVAGLLRRKRLGSLYLNDVRFLDARIKRLEEEMAGLEEQLETARAEAARSEKYAEERDLVAQQFEEQFEVADAFARVADAYCWDSETTTHDDLMNARAEWQTQIGRMKLRAASSPAKERRDA